MIHANKFKDKRKKKKKKRFDDDYLNLKSSRSGSPFPHPPQDGREEGCVFRPPTKATQVKEKKSMCWVKDIKCMCVIPTYAPCD